MALATVLNYTPGTKTIVLAGLIPTENITSIVNVTKGKDIYVVGQNIITGNPDLNNNTTTIVIDYDNADEESTDNLAVRYNKTFSIIWNGSVDNIELTETNGLIDTYTIWGDADKTINLGTFDVANGVGIESADYAPLTGILTFTFTDSSEFATDDLRADLDAATIKTRYESNDNTNTFTDAEKSKLESLEPGISNPIAIVYQSIQSITYTQGGNSTMDNGSYNTFSLIANGTGTTIAHSNVPVAGNRYGFELHLAWSSGTITWPASWTKGDSVPTATGNYVITGVSVDGGTSWKIAILEE